MTENEWMNGGKNEKVKERKKESVSEIYEEGIKSWK